MKCENIVQFKKEHVPYQLGRLKLLMNKVFGRILKREGVDLTPEQAHVLGFLLENETCSMNEIASELMVDNSAITRLVDGLEAKKFVKRTISKEDRRQRVVAITSQGEEEIWKTMQLTENYRQSLLEGISKEEKQQLLRMLAIMHDNSEKSLLNLEK